MSEKLSNLLDKNVPESDLDEFLRECKQDPSLMDRWQRYHLAGGVIRNEIDETDLNFDIASKVMANLESQSFDAKQSDLDNSNVIALSAQSDSASIDLSTTSMPTESVSEELVSKKSVSKKSVSKKSKATNSWTSKPWVPLALAASMLLGLYVFFQQPVIETAPQQVADNTAIDATLPVAVDQWQTSNRDVEDILNSLLVEHSEFTSVTGMNGLGSYSKFIAYQN